MSAARRAADQPIPQAPNILQFPDRHENRPVQAEIGMGSAGFLAMMLMDRDGEAHPANVKRFDEPDGASLPSQSPELLLALLVWDQLSPKKKASVSSHLRAMAYSKKPDQSAVQLLNMLCGRQ